MIFAFKYKKHVAYSNVICSLLLNDTAEGRKLGCELKLLRKAKIWYVWGRQPGEKRRLLRQEMIF